MTKKTIYPSKILLPNDSVDLTLFSTIACDQFTSEKNYWEELEGLVLDKPSCLNLVFPEVYLSNDNSERIAKINENMQKYLDEGIFKEEREGYILTVRKTSYGITRVGIVLSIDLEDYSFDEDTNALIRSTEGTVMSRIPPRVEIRENAKLEFPHILLLSNDSEFSIIENFYNQRESLEKVYDFDLNMNGGHIEGYFISADIDLNEKFMQAKMGDMLFAVGDGNHSLATAKTIYEKKKANGEDTSLCRFAMCEVVNLTSKGITFEPIHRLVTGVDNGKFIQGLNFMVRGRGFVGVATKGYERPMSAPSETAECYDAVQGYIDFYLEENGGEVDYIHGFESLNQLVEETDGVGIIMPKLDKKELFKTIEEYGSLPRKTFSMGEATEKRYYLEGRKIK